MPEIDLLENVPLAPYTTLGIGGPAKFFASVSDAEELVRALKFANQENLRVFILGGGSNIVISDEGFNGLVIRNAIGLDRFDVDESGEKVQVTVGSGMSWDAFVARCVDEDLAGVECLSGIPGTVGGTPIQNVGAYGQEVSQSITRVKCISRGTLETVDFSNQGCEFSYRSSIFNREMRDLFVVVAVSFQLPRGGPPNVTFKELSERFSGRSPTLCEIREAVLEIRAAKSMVIDAGDPNSRRQALSSKTRSCQRRS